MSWPFGVVRCCRASPCAIGTSRVRRPALIGVEGTDELVASRVLLGITILALRTHTGAGDEQKGRHESKPHLLAWHNSAAISAEAGPSIKITSKGLTRDSDFSHRGFPSQFRARDGAKHGAKAC